MDFCLSTKTRTDTSAAVVFLGWRGSALTRDDNIRLKRVFRYILGTYELGLSTKCNKEMQIPIFFAHGDRDWVCEIEAERQQAD